ncbi:MAG TPA: hypothetical protein VNS12_10755 [Pelagibacterium sp.]|uniref:hypothetical protein n=1 Tax=Pelagibacterium sp. TaxID=1967288 RepID=UPI002BDB1B9F|nr:hypothetical protein [Pelagibacterium sp.]HWJ88541.1 hypothetical protein [Pelagibacterium sp.]
MSKNLLEAVDAIDRARFVAHTVRLVGNGILGEDRMFGNALCEVAGQIVEHLDTAVSKIETRPNEPDPDRGILLAYQEWSDAQEALAAAQGDADDQLEAEYSAIRTAEDKVLSFAPTTARALAIQVIVFTSFYEFALTANGRFDLEAAVESIAAVERPLPYRHSNPGSAA